MQNFKQKMINAVAVLTGFLFVGSVYAAAVYYPLRYVCNFCVIQGR